MPRHRGIQVPELVCNSIPIPLSRDTPHDIQCPRFPVDAANQITALSLDSNLRCDEGCIGGIGEVVGAVPHVKNGSSQKYPDSIPLKLII